MRDGVVLGAAVGFGFGALEITGYAFASMLTSGGLSIPDLVQTEVIRGLMAPLGHGLWTGIAGGVHGMCGSNATRRRSALQWLVRTGILQIPRVGCPEQ